MPLLCAELTTLLSAKTCITTPNEAKHGQFFLSLDHWVQSTGVGYGLGWEALAPWAPFGSLNMQPVLAHQWSTCLGQLVVHPQAD